MTILKAGQDAEKLDRSNLADGNVKWYSPSGKQISISLEKLNTYLPYDLAIILLDIYYREIKLCPCKTCTWVLLPVLFVTALKETTQVFFSGWMVKQITAHSYSAKKEQSIDRHNWMDIKSTILSWGGGSTKLEMLHIVWFHLYSIMLLK